MQSLLTQYRLACLLQAIAEFERKLESTRQVLSDQTLFDSYIAFQLLDSQRQGHIMRSDLKSFMSKNNVILSENEIINVFVFLDVDKDGKICYSDFLKSVTPRFSFLTKESSLLLEKELLFGGNQPTFEIEWCLTLFIEEISRTSLYLESLREALKQASDFNLREAFSLIDCQNQKFIDQTSIDAFLKKMGKNLSKNEILGFIKTFEKSNNGKILFEDFFEIILGFPDLSDKSPPFLVSYKRLSKQESLEILESQFISSEGSLEYSQTKKSLDAISEKINTLRSRVSIENSQRNSLNAHANDNLRFLSLNTPKRIPKLSFRDQREFPTPRGIVSSEGVNENFEENQRKLLEYLKFYLGEERGVEDLRKELALKNDFSISAGFQLLERTGKGYLRKDELVQVLKDLEITDNSSEKGVELIFEIFNRKKDGMLNLFDFIEIVSPLNESFRYVAKNRTLMRIDFSPSTLRLFKKVLQKTIEKEMKIEEIQNFYFKNCNDFGNFLKSLDFPEKSSLKIADLERFLKKAGILATESELALILQRLRTLSGPEDGITYEEFKQEIESIVIDSKNLQNLLKFTNLE